MLRLRSTCVRVSPCVGSLTACHATASPSPSSHRTCGSPADSRPEPASGYALPQAVGFAPARSGLPGSWLIVRRAPPPIAPESPTGALARCSPVDGRLHHVGKAGRSQGGFRGRSEFTLLRLTASPSKASYPGLLRRTLGRLLVERAIYKASSFQLARSTRLILAHPTPPSQESEVSSQESEIRGRESEVA